MRRVLAALVALGIAAAGAQPLTAPREHVRGPEQTFLTFPEWFLVFSPAEYAAYVARSTPTEFPFVGHICQFWTSYGAAARKANEHPFNLGYHVMIMVIGVSTTVEYALRSAYETVVGRLSEAAAEGGLTDEDRLGAKVAQEYVDFIRVQPWYEFDFMAPLARLWDQPATGPGLVRKWERRYALSTEYLIKGAYGWLIKKGTKASYEAPLPVTAVVVRGLPAGHSAKDQTVVERRADGSALVLLPRYQAFTDHAVALAAKGVSFEEIAGNRTVILVSAIVPPNVAAPPRNEILFEQPIETQPGAKRVALVVPVGELAPRLAALEASGVALEHVFDF